MLPPLMRKFVRAKPTVLFVFEYLLPYDSFNAVKLLISCSTPPAARTCAYVLSEYLTPRVFKEIEHVGRVAKDPAYFTLVVARCEVLELNVSSFLFEDVKGPAVKTKM
jgi:hypothetical protein